MKRISSGIVRRIPVFSVFFPLPLPTGMDQYQILGYLHLHLATKWPVCRAAESVQHFNSTGL